MKDTSSRPAGLTILPLDRDRLVRLCAHLTGCANVAEDLAQETLIEAWRQRSKLDRPAGQAAWLAAIARNVCRRWRSRQGVERRYSALALPDDNGSGEAPEDGRWADDVDLELTLERQELADLLDRALALLPEVSRQVLLYRYVEDLPQAEIAARLGLSEGAVAVRVHRGKLALRRVLAQDCFSDQSVYAPQRTDAWEATRLWCTVCGTRRLLGRLAGDPTVLALRCPGDCNAPGDVQTECAVPGGASAGAYGRAVSRVRTAVDRHYGLNRRTDEPACVGCGRPTPLRVGPAGNLPPDLQTRGVHVYVSCAACGAVSHSSLEGVVLSLPEGQRFLRRHPRVRAIPPREIEIDGLPALVTRFESRDDAAGIDVLIRRHDFRVIAIRGAPES
jgi:RNA polymerase sigma factor (sigma-70 family)